ncbi:9edde234-e9b1-43cf-919d-e49d1e2a517c [Thermothielavioides terrestris]|uniref:9edde234-e9b1-43cf-919d-e49d1e2a517c n=1 Tax=Thermothielavioides terrestris TaxID=2587410 RepID=A0A446BI61_9PEZI|nr:9edde234-e9b1-43cf-919d-e49d1e2a517c [Thermothielavioides terrestris]
MEVPSLLSTPSRSSSNSQPSQHSQQSSLDLSSPSPRPAVYDGVGPDPQSLSDYCADIKVLMDIDAQVQALGIHDSPSPTAVRDGSSNFNSRENASSYSLEPYRHGQMGAFRHSPRFDQASRPIVSDNWRAKSAADSAGPLVSSLVTTAKPSTPTTQNQAQAQPRTSFVYTPARTPLTAPSNTGTAGFAQLSANPPQTPASLSTPVSMSAPSHSQSHGHGHHSSTGSLALSAPGYSPVSTRSGNPDPPSSSQMMGSLLSANHAKTDTNTSMNAKPPNTTSTVATFPVALPADALGYCFVRPNGMRTRLVPVDMLPFALQGIPPHESPGERLVALPVPGGVGPDGRSSNTQMLRAVNHPSGSGGVGGDAIQSQGQPHHAGAPKRMKVYCDKWVHEGVCAFTQQGCKYKHEMPSDRATQHQLGLFLGYPAWWKRRQAELARVVPVGGKQGGGGCRCFFFWCFFFFWCGGHGDVGSVNGVGDGDGDVDGNIDGWRAEEDRG